MKIFSEKEIQEITRNQLLLNLKAGFWKIKDFLFSFSKGDFLKDHPVFVENFHILFSIEIFVRCYNEFIRHEHHRKNSRKIKFCAIKI